MVHYNTPTRRRFVMLHGAGARFVGRGSTELAFDFGAIVGTNLEHDWCEFMNLAVCSGIDRGPLLHQHMSQVRKATLRLRQVRGERQCDRFEHEHEPGV